MSKKVTHELFLLARQALSKSPKAYKNLDEIFLTNVFDNWFVVQAKDLIKEYLREDLYEEFLGMCEYANTPIAGNPFHQACISAKIAKYPKEAKYFEHESFKELVSICYQLHLIMEGPFHLSCRQIQEKFNLPNPMRARTRLRALQRKGIIMELTKGTLATRKSTQWIYQSVNIP